MPALAATAALLLTAFAAWSAPSAPPGSKAPAFRCEPPTNPTPAGAELRTFCARQRADALACRARGGAWSGPGMLPHGPHPTCHLPTPDAGKACTTNGQCRDSACVPNKGSATDSPGHAVGRCDRYGDPLLRACSPTIENGTVVTPAPCPVI